MAFFEKNLYEAVATGNISEVNDFFKHGLSADFVFHNTKHPKSLGKTLLEVAAEKGQYEMVQILSTHKCNPNLKMIVDVEDGAIKMKPYVKQNRLKLTCVYSCIVKNDVQMIQLLITGGLDVNIHDDRGCTPLWHAVDINSFPMVKALVSCPGCDVNICDVTKLCPLHVAAIHANVKVVSLLISHGAAIDATTVIGSTPLILACKSACYDTCRLLLLNGANPNHVGHNGHTPISAVLESCLDRRIMDMLIEAGASVDAADVQKCMNEKLPLLETNPDVLRTFRILASTPRSLKVQCCLVIRKHLLDVQSKLHLLQKVQQLPLPNSVKEFLLLIHL